MLRAAPRGGLARTGRRPLLPEVPPRASARAILGRKDEGGEDGVDGGLVVGVVLWRVLREEVVDEAGAGELGRVEVEGEGLEFGVGGGVELLLGEVRGRGALRLAAGAAGPGAARLPLSTKTLNLRTYVHPRLPLQLPS